MKTKKKDINLRELFRQNLENTEVIPDASVKSKLMRRVAGKEFLRLNAGRFNIYYLGGLLITGITATVLIFSSPRRDNRLNTSVPSDKLKTVDTGSYFKVPIEQPVNKISVKSDMIKKRLTNKENSFNHADSVKANIYQDAESLKISIVIPQGVNVSSSGINVSSPKSVTKNMLQTKLLPDSVLIDPAVSDGCAPLKIKFYNRSDSYDSCKWTFGDGGYSYLKNPEWIFDVEGEYKVILNVFEHNGKTLISTAKVTVHPRPKAKFEIAPEKAMVPNDEIHFANYSSNAVQFKWNFGDGNTSELFEPRHAYSKYGNYNVSLIAFSDWGCSDSLIVKNAFSESEYYITFPNAFIPNLQGPSGGYYSQKSDETAQVFHPSYSGIADYQLKIFSKLAILIFESNDINIGWDGYNKGQLCEPGVYIWKVRGKFRNGDPFIRMGDVTLLKK